MQKSRSVQPVKLVVSVFTCLFAGYIGSFFTGPSIPTWYADLNKPPFTPPNGVFAPVWTALFVLMGISAYLVWHEGLRAKGVKPALILFDIQLVLNVVWSFLFFGLESPFYAFVEIVVLWVAIALTIIAFRKVSRAAGLLLLPYLAWVTFATILTFSVWRLNL